MALTTLSLVLSVVSIVLAFLASTPALFRIVAPHYYESGLELSLLKENTDTGPNSRNEIFQWEEFECPPSISVSHDPDPEFPLTYHVEFDLTEQWVLSENARQHGVIVPQYHGTEGSRYVTSELTVHGRGGFGMEFPFVPKTEQCIVTVRAIPYLEPTEVRLPYWFPRARLKPVEEEYTIRAEEVTVDQYIDRDVLQPRNID